MSAATGRDLTLGVSTPIDKHRPGCVLLATHLQSWRDAMLAAVHGTSYTSMTVAPTASPPPVT
jgi:hypothetical protein